MNIFKQYLVLCFLMLWFTSCSNKTKIVEKNGMVLVKGDGEFNDLWVDKYPVSVAQFEDFINATHYKTQAEQFGDAAFFDFETGKWSLKKGAYWKYPLGRDTTAAPKNHPVTQVSWNDTQAYCKWANKRLPSSKEFLHLEKNAQSDYEKTYTWGENFVENGIYKANFWQGSFPYHNTAADGFLTTSPVGFFGVNALGLADLGGNVWQWCSDENPERPTEWFQKGGSYLCNPTVCHGFKVGGSSSSTKESSLQHVGFRCVREGK